MSSAHVQLSQLRTTDCRRQTAAMFAGSLIGLFTFGLHAQTYEVTDFGSGAAINDAGDILRNTPNGVTLQRDDTVVELDGLSQGVSLNNRGQVIGYSNDGRAAMWSNGVTVPMAPPVTNSASLSFPVGINDFGRAVLTMGSNQDRAFSWFNGTLTQLPHPQPQFSQVVRVSSINNDGWIVGHAFVREPNVFLNTTTHGMLWKGGTVTDLGTLGGYFSNALDINESGQIVGQSSTEHDSSYQPALWSGGRVTALASKGEARSINDLGQVVGNTTFGAFMWSDGITTDLNSLIPSGSGWKLESASSIDNLGHIIGTGTYQGQRRNFLLTPTHVDWTNPAGGSFDFADNWSTQVTPTATDSVTFALPASYEVNFATGRASRAATLRCGNVVFQLNGHDYNIQGPLTVGVGNRDAALTVRQGTLRSKGGTIHGQLNVMSGSWDATGGNVTILPQGRLQIGSASAGATVVGNIAVGAGGTLGGRGVVQGDVANAGTVVLSVDGPLEVSGSFKQEAGGTLVAPLANGSHGTITVGGVGRLDGQLRLTEVDSSRSESGREITLIRSAAVTGEFSNLKRPDGAAIAAAAEWDRKFASPVVRSEADEARSFTVSYAADRVTLKAPQKVYLDFDNPAPLVEELTTIGKIVFDQLSSRGTTPAAVDAAGLPLSQEYRQEVRTRIAATYARAGIENVVFVDSPDASASTLYFCKPPQGTTNLGVAERLDQFNQVKNDRALVYAKYDDPFSTARTAAHELGHLLGLRHIGQFGEFLDVLHGPDRVGNGVFSINEEFLNPDELLTHNATYHLERYVDGTPDGTLRDAGILPGTYDSGVASTLYNVLTFSSPDTDDRAGRSLSLNPTLYRVTLLRQAGEAAEQISLFESTTLAQLDGLSFELLQGAGFQLVAASTSGGPFDIVLDTGHMIEDGGSLIPLSLGSTTLTLRQLVAEGNAVDLASVTVASVVPEPTLSGASLLAATVLLSRRRRQPA